MTEHEPPKDSRQAAAGDVEHWKDGPSPEWLEKYVSQMQPAEVCPSCGRGDSFFIHFCRQFLTAIWRELREQMRREHDFVASSTYDLGRRDGRRETLEDVMQRIEADSHDEPVCGEPVRWYRLRNWLAEQIGGE